MGDVRSTGRFGDMQRVTHNWWWGTAVMLAVAVALAAAYLYRTTQRELDAARAAAAVSIARVERARVSQWDRAAYDEIQASLRRAYQHDRAWRAAPVSITHARHARALYAAIEVRSAAAARASDAAEREALRVSASMVRDADEALASTAEVANAVYLAGARRSAYQQARLALYEARAYHQRGDYVSAADRARRAIDLAGRVRAHAVGLVARFEDAGLVHRWRSWHRALVEWSRREGKLALVVDKAHHRLYVYESGRETAVVQADMGFNWAADKQHAGDGATPEGRYRVVALKGLGASQYHKALLLDYPNGDDRREFERARRTGGLPARAGIGGLIEIHGEGARGKDWTRGCVAVSNRDMDDLFVQTSVGTPVLIVGSLGGPIAAAGPAREARGLATASARGGV